MFKFTTKLTATTLTGSVYLCNMNPFSFFHGNFSIQSLSAGYKSDQNNYRFNPIWSPQFHALVHEDLATLLYIH